MHNNRKTVRFLIVLALIPVSYAGLRRNQLPSNSAPTEEAGGCPDWEMMTAELKPPADEYSGTVVTMTGPSPTRTR
jgi:hypothetical protein